MKLPPAMVEELVTVARAAHAAPRGGKEAVYAAAAHRLGLSRATLLRHLHSVAVRPQRKRRADSGQFELPGPRPRRFRPICSSTFAATASAASTWIRL